MSNQRGYAGELPPARFNMARYCLEAAARAIPDKVALIVVSDARAPVERAERWTYARLGDAVQAMRAAPLDAEALRALDAAVAELLPG